MKRQSSLRTQLERATYDKAKFHKNILRWKQSFEEVQKILEADRKKK